MTGIADEIRENLERLVLVHSDFSQNTRCFPENFNPMPLDRIQIRAQGALD
jgi:hypothetical protein